MSNEMNLAQATELHALLTTCRPVKEMNVRRGAIHGLRHGKPGCLLCHGHREGLYTLSEAADLDMPKPFSMHFGCTEKEAEQLIFLGKLGNGFNSFHPDSQVTGENYYQAGKKLLIKYGYGHLFEEPKLPFTVSEGAVHFPSPLSFDEIMNESKKEAEPA